MNAVLPRGRVWLYVGSCLLAASVFLCPAALAQLPAPGSAAPASPSEVPEDALGRTTPRGTVLGFLSAARKEDYQRAAQYLNTKQRGKAAAVLAEKLSVVIDRRLPARLNELSNVPEGSQSNLLAPQQELVGTIVSLNGKVDVLLERVKRGKSGYIWLFSSQTLAAVPDLYEEVNAISVENVLPAFFLNKFLGFMVAGWLCLFLGLPLLYLLLTLLNRLLGALEGSMLRRLGKGPDQPKLRPLPHPIRLLLLAYIIHWSLSKVSLPLLSRQFWSTTSIVITIIGCVWLFMLANERCELYVKRRLERQSSTGAASLVRLARRALDGTAIFVGLLFGLHSFGVNPTAALAGLGVGGIAVALAAQKTLENVIGGASLIFDRAVRVGDFFKVGDIVGTVEEVGLRSTRVRTLAHTVVTIPNGQVANMTLEDFSFRRRFWFHHVVGLRYETTSSEMSSILGAIRDLLARDSRVIRDSGHVRFVRFGQSSLDVEVFVYISARDWPNFLEVQEELLLHIMNLVQEKGSQIAMPSQTVYLAHGAGTSTAQPLRKGAPSGNRP